MRRIKVVDGAFLRSRVARRIFGLFMLSAFLPVLALMALSAQQIKGLLDGQARSQLAQSALVYGHALYDRLLAREAALRAVARASQVTPAVALTASESLGSGFRRVVLVRTDGSRETLLGGDAASVPAQDEQMRAHLAKGETYLLSMQEESREARVLMLRRLAARDETLLVAELDLQSLWGDADAYEDRTRFCVLDNVPNPLHCTREEDKAAVSRFAGAREDRAEALVRSGSWESGERRTMASARALFLEPKFGTPYWTFVALQPETDAMAPVQRFARMFLAVAVLTLATAALLSVAQIRRTLVPLERLISGTRRIARRDFSSAVEVTSNDEFGELAASMTVMARRLGRQFDVLRTLSEVDRLILSKLELDRVVEIVLRSLPAVVAVDVVGVSLLDTREGGALRTCTWSSGSYTLSDVARSVLEPALAERMLRHHSGLRLAESDAGEAPFLEPLRRAGARSFLVLPVIWQQALCAIVSLGWRESIEVDAEDIDRLRDLSDRIGVAISAAARDEQLYRQAHYDTLSELPNRWLFEDRLTQELAHAERKGDLLALLFIDLDRFKTINDTQGHHAGDEALQETARRLRGLLRESDTAARFGGDEFVVILPGLKAPSSAAMVAAHLLESLSQPYRRDGQEHYLSASIGIAMYPGDGGTVDTLLRKADTAMYRAKEGGRGRFVFFEERMNHEAVERVALERELRQALQHNQFVVHYQPQMSLRDGSIVGVEALVRWNHPERGLLLPDRFIGLAEETGLIDSLGQWVLREAAREYGVWRNQGIVLPRVAVNVAGRQFKQQNFVRMVGDVLRSSGMPPRALELELTESVLVSDADAAVEAMHQLADLGVRIAIDDFGTGYSSMAYLRRLPNEVLKVDCSFVKDIEHDEEAAEITRAMIGVGHVLRRQVVAEGVESAGQLALLRAWDCDQIQGHYLSRPLPPADLVRWMHQYRKGEHPQGRVLAASSSEESA